MNRACGVPEAHRLTQRSTSDRSIRRDLPGYLAARLGDYIVEFRNKDRWDAAIPRSAILVHRFEDNHSYLMSANDGQQDLVASSTFGDDPASNPLNLFANVTRLEVVEINETGQFATIRLEHRARSVLDVGPGILFGGVAAGGDGLLFSGGKFVRTVAAGPTPRASRSLREHKRRGVHAGAIGTTTRGALIHHGDL
jgi:hypothetical protein